MKKILIACFMALIIILLPVSVNSVNVNAKKITNPINSKAEEPQMYITTMERLELMVYVNENFEEQNQNQAIAILNTIISYNSDYQLYDIDMPILIKFIENYSYYHIIPQLLIDNAESKTELNIVIDQFWNFSDYPFAGLLDTIVEIIKDRLGWIYDLFFEAGTLFVEGVNLAKQFIMELENLPIAKLVTTVVNVLVAIPVIYFSESINQLFNLNFQGFIDTISTFTGVFTDQLSDLITLAESILQELDDYFQPLLIYISDIGDFVDWVISEPWKNSITVRGNAINFLLSSFTGAEVTCRDGSDITDNEGKFEFTVNPSNNSMDSIPANSWYGLHLCVITISKNGEVIRQTPELLSYVFSGGTIEWSFIVPRSRSRGMIVDNIGNQFQILVQWFQHFFPIFFRDSYR